MATTIRIVVSAEDRASRPIRDVADAASEAGERTRGFGSRLWEVGDAATNAGSLISTYVTAPFTQSIGVAAGFQQAMAGVGAISRASEADLARLTETARGLGATTSFSASQAAEGMQFLAMAGFSTNEIVAAMPGLLNAAAASGADLGRTADIVSNIMSGFGLEAGEAARIADVLTAAATSANTDMTGLGEAMKYVAPVASGLGMSLEDAATAVAMMAESGIQGSMAGTALRASLLRLANPSKDAAGLMAELGINAFTAEGSLRPLPELAGEFTRGLAGMSEQQTTAALATIVGQEAVSGFMAVIRQGEQGLADYSQSLSDSGGTAERVATQQLNTFEGRVKILNSGIEALQITVGDRLLPVLTRLVEEALIPAVNWFGALDPNIQLAAIGFVAFVALLGPALLLLGGIASGITAISGAFSAFAALAPLFGAAWTVATGPVGLVVLGIAALVGAIAGLKWAWDNDFLGLQTTVWAWGDDIARGLVVVAGFFGAWGADIARGWSALSSDARRLADNLVQRIGDIPAMLGRVGWDIVDGIWDGLWAGWQNLLRNTGNLVGGFVDTFKFALGIRSPSTVMRDLFRFVGDGAALGLADRTPALLEAGEELARGSVRGASGELARAAGGATAVAGETHYHLHIETSAPTEPIQQDFAMLRAMAGAGGW